MRDTAGRMAGAARRGARVLLSPAGVRGTAVEVAWIAAHLATYPFGVASERTRVEVDRFTLHGLPPVHRGLVIGDVEAAGTPILLVHGLVDNRSIFTLLRRGLRRRGFGRVWTMNYRALNRDLRGVAARLERTVEAICEETGYERIHVIGHSLGGVIARYYVQRMGGDARVHTLVTLGSPHAGTRAAHLLPNRVCQQLRPSSELLRELAEPAPECRTRFVAFWSDLDALMVPKRSARIEHDDLAARNVFVGGVGHMSLPIDARVVREIVATLAHLDAAGGTVEAGVTRLEPGRPPVASRISGSGREAARVSRGR